MTCIVFGCLGHHLFQRYGQSINWRVLFNCQDPGDANIVSDSNDQAEHLAPPPSPPRFMVNPNARFSVTSDTDDDDLYVTGNQLLGARGFQDVSFCRLIFHRLHSCPLQVSLA